MPNFPEYEVYAIKYGDHQRSRQENFLYDDPHDGSGPLDYYVWVIAGGGRTFVVDLGFEHEEAKRRERNLIRLPSEAIRLVGVDPATVEEVIITHMHYDHSGDMKPFPKARFYVQDREMAFATGRHMAEEAQRLAYNVDYVCDFVRAVYDERVHFIDGAHELAPGVSVHHIGGHTDGVQAVRVWTRKGWLVLASDATHLYENMGKPNPFPIIFSLDDMLAGYTKLQKLAEGNLHHVIPGHDPLVMQMFPPVSKELTGVACRLDADPIGDLDHVWGLAR